MNSVRKQEILFKKKLVFRRQQQNVVEQIKAPGSLNQSCEWHML